MNRIDELIKKLCPNGVEYKKANEIKIESFWLMPSTPTYIAEGVPYITSKNIKNGKINFENVNYISEKDYLSISSNRTIKKNDLLITMIGTIGETAFVEEDIKFYGQNMYLIRLNEKVINRKFFNYYLTSEKIKNSLVSRKNTSSQGYIKAGSIENLLLPVPPLEVQREIVHVLDYFTLLSAELSAELKARKEQFNYYRDELIKTAHGAKYKTLSEIATDMYRGTGIKRDEVTETGIPCVRYGEIYTTYNVLFDACASYTDEAKQKSKKYFEYGDVLFAITGESVEEIGKSTVYIGKEKCLAGGDIVVMKHNENPKYIGYALSTTEAQMQKSKGKIKSKVVHSSIPALKEISIPIPSLKEQERIANIIENFDKICNDITSGLPAEIEARQKQYEYYRDKLLTFKELKVNE